MTTPMQTTPSTMPTIDVQSDALPYFLASFVRLSSAAEEDATENENVRVLPKTLRTPINDKALQNNGETF